MAYDYTTAVGTYQTLLDERREWEQEWRTISDYLLPGRGIYTGLTRPQKRKISPSDESQSRGTASQPI